LNSTVGTTTTASEAVDRMQYYPFGSVRGGGVATDRTYTGQQSEAGSALKLSYYHARFYSAELGHFVSADSSSGSGLNRFAYVGDNPIMSSDPTGHCGAPDPCASPLPTPAESDPVTACAQNQVACLTWSWLMSEGAAQQGLVIAMGIGQGTEKWREYENYVRLFWSKFLPRCTGAGESGCMSALGALLRMGGRREAFSVFGVFFIPTTASGMLGKVTGVGWDLVRHATGLGEQPGMDDMDWVMNQGAVAVQAVIGFSKGAALVSSWYARNEDSKKPFFLIEPFGFVAGGSWFGDPDFDPRALHHKAFKGSFPLASCEGYSHCEHDDQALAVMQDLLPSEFPR
jgi:RHS repeat-associated protein